MILQEKKRRELFTRLAGQLQEKGIACEIFLWQDMGTAFEKDFPRTALYITDQETVLRQLYSQNLPLAAYLHEENKGQDFSKAKYAFENPYDLEPEYLERVYRRYWELPWDILQTEHCILRESIPEDIDAFYEIYKEPGMTQYTDALYENKSTEKAALQAYIEKVYHYYEFGIWTVLLKETGQVIGRAGITIRAGSEIPEIGYMIGKPWQGKGLAAEVCREILQYAKEELFLERIHAFVHPENAASLRVAQKTGFCRKGKTVIGGTEYILLQWEDKISQ